MDFYALNLTKSFLKFEGQEVVMKDPKGVEHDWVMEQYALSHEVSCTIILHPNIVNYIGGVELGSGQKDDLQR